VVGWCRKILGAKTQNNVVRLTPCLLLVEALGENNSPIAMMMTQHELHTLANASSGELVDSVRQADGSREGEANRDGHHPSILCCTSNSCI